VFENRVLRRIFGPKDKVPREWRKIHNEELTEVYFSPNTAQDKTEKDGIGGHLRVRGSEEAYTGIWWGNLRERDHLGDPSIDERIILRWIFRKWDYGLDRPGSGQGQAVGTCECSNERSGSIKCGAFLDYLKTG
jgi:hypothetical protein